MRSSFLPALAACWLSASLAQGCFLDATAFEAGATGTGTTAAGSGGGATGSAPGAGGGGSGGAGSGAAPTTGGSGGETTTTTDTGTTTAMACSVDAQCPDPPSLCLGAKCDNGFCTTANVAEGILCGAATGDCFDAATCDKGDCVSKPKAKNTALSSPFFDCKKRRCGADGMIEEVPDDADHKLSDECMSRTCNAGQPVETEINTGGGCLIASTCCQGACCPGAGSCCANSGICNYGVCP